MVVKGIIQVFFGQLLLNRWVSFQQWPEWHLFSPALSRVWLNQIIGVFPRHARLNQLEQDPARVNQTQRLIHVLLHGFREDVQICQDPAKTVQHVVQKRRRVWQNHSFSAGVRNVAFMPQCHVFISRNDMTAQYPRTAADIFGADRVALVRHC